MPKNNQTNPRNNFVPLVLPWLLGAGMLAFYVATLNHWITLLNLEAVARASGWLSWQVQVTGPLTYLALLPFRCLSPAQVPYLLNLFSAVCAALVLVLLARSVALLPQDRTEPQRERERSDFSFLTGWPAFFPPILAVLFGGLQLAFWQQATSFTGEMFDLLLFAIVVWLILEYRLDEKPWRLCVAIVIFGAGLAESVVFFNLLPLLMIVLIWLKGAEFFNLRFLLQMTLCGLLGMSFFLFLPLVAKFSGITFPFWNILRPNLQQDWSSMLWLQTSIVRHNVAEACLTTVLPVLFMSLRWKAGFGDSSRLGGALANGMIHLVYAAVFSACVWAAFDPPFSAGQLLSSPCLPLNYLSALAIGYYCGYFLLVFGKKSLPTRRNSRPPPLLPKPLMWICPIVVGGTFVAAALSLGVLLYRNVPIMHELHDEVLLKFAAATTQDLPKGGGVLLCDSDTPGQNRPIRALLIQAMLTREGRDRDFAVVDTQMAGLTAYNRLLHKHYPNLWPAAPNEPYNTNTEVLSSLGLYNQLVSISQSNTIFYLNPSYGYYFERFYQEPHGLAYQMKTLPADTLLPPAPSHDLVVQNENFWAQTTKEFRPAIVQALSASDTDLPMNFPNWFLMHLHPAPVVDQDAILVGMLCSRGLDYWGVRLQRAGELNEAARSFSAAREFNPDNVVADINLKFNQTLRSNAPVRFEPVSTDQFGKYRNWNDVITANGPFDEISFCLQDAMQLMQNELFHQAIQEFTRVRQLAPHNLYVRLQLAQIFLLSRLPDRALEALQAPLETPHAFGLNEQNSTSLDILDASAHFQKNELSAGSRLLDIEIERHPNDDELTKLVTKAYFARGMYSNALQVIDHKLSASPNDIPWLFVKSYASIQAGAYQDAIDATTRVLKLQTNDASARFNRALAYLKDNRLDDARADYLQLQTTYTNSYQVAYGLGDIAEHQHETNEAVRNFQIYAANAPTNSVEYTNVLDRLTRLRGK